MGERTAQGAVEAPTYQAMTPSPDSPDATKGDLLRLDYINSLPQPFIARFIGGDEWPVHDIDVQTGLLRIDVCGKLDVKHIADVRFFRDEAGVEHDSETFYSDYEPSAATPCAIPEPAQASMEEEARRFVEALPDDISLGINEVVALEAETAKLLTRVTEPLYSRIAADIIQERDTARAEVARLTSRLATVERDRTAIKAALGLTTLSYEPSLGVAVQARLTLHAEHVAELKGQLEVAEAARDTAVARVAELESQNVEMRRALERSLLMAHQDEDESVIAREYRKILRAALTSPQPPLIGVLERVRDALTLVKELLPTEGEAKDEASLNDGRASTSAVAASRVNTALAELNRYLPAARDNEEQP